MAVAYDDVATANTGGVDAASLTIAAPAGLAAGDVMYAAIEVNNEAGLTAPSGWVTILRPYFVSATPAGGQLSVFRKVAAAGDVGASYTWTKSLAQKWAGVIVNFSGASPTTPEIGSVAKSIDGAAAGTAASTGTIASAVSGQLVVDLYAAISDPAGTPSFTAGSGTERADKNDGSQGAVEAVTGATSAPGTAGTSTISTASAWASVRVVIGPRFWETPNAPSLVSPIGGSSQVLDEDITLVHLYSHPDSGDTQSAAEHRYRLVDTTSWTTVALVGADVDNVIAGGTLTAGAYEWQARAASSLGTYGAWSPSGFFTAIAEPDPPIFTNPTDGATVGAEETATFTLVGTATQVEWRRVADNAGTPDTGTVYDSDTIVGNVRSFEVEFDVTGRTEHLQVRAEVSGTFTDWSSIEVLVSYTGPAEPTFTATVVDNAAVTIEVENSTELLNEAEALWAVSQYGGSGALLDLSGNGHDLALPGGSNDPKFLAFAGTTYIYAPGVAGNRLLIPDEAALDITGDIDVRVWLALDDWTPALAGGSALVNKRTTTGTQSSWRLLIDAGGHLTLAVWDSGGSLLANAASTDALGLTDGTAKWVRATRVAATGTITFYTSDDGSSWSMLGSPVVDGIGSMFSGTADVFIGSESTDPSQLSGKVYQVQLYNGIAGTKVLDVDTSAATAAATTFTAVTGQTVTIVRPATGRQLAVVDRDLFLFGTDDYLTTPDHANLDFAAADPFTVVTVFRANYNNVAGTIIAKRAGTTGTGWVLRRAATTSDNTFGIGDGTNNTDDAQAAATARTVQVAAGVRSVASDNLRAYTDATSTAATTDATTATLANSEAVRIGRLSGAGTGYCDFEFMAAAIWRRALTDVEVATLTAALFVDPVPDATSNNIWRREVGDAGAGIRVAADLDADASWTDWTVASGIAYEYRVEAVAANGAITTTGWQA